MLKSLYVEKFSGGIMFARFMLCFFAFASAGVQAQDRTPRGEAHWLLERLTGVKWPGTAPVITEMANRIQAGDKAGASQIAINQKQFLNVTVKQFALKMSTRAETVNADFNDFTAAFIGVTRDNRDARELLTGKLLLSRSNRTKQQSCRRHFEDKSTLSASRRIA